MEVFLFINFILLIIKLIVKLFGVEKRKKSQLSIYYANKHLKSAKKTKT